MKTSKFVKVVLAAVFILFSLGYLAILAQEKLTISADTEHQEIQLIDGTYEGKSFKFPGRMRISVSVKRGEITDIKILKHMSPKKHNKMLKELIDRIIKRQSTRVDGVTGATMSSNALKKAVEDALRKASTQSAEEE